MTFLPMVTVALFAEAWLGQPTAGHGVHAFFRSRSRQNLQPATRLGKTFGNPFIMATTLFSDRAHAKTGDSRPTVWEKHFGNGLSWPFPHQKAALTPKQTTHLGKSKRKPFIMAIPREKAAITPKRTTCDPRFGKNIGKPVYHGDFLMKKRLSRQNRRPATGLGKFPAETAYLGDRQKPRDRIGEAIRTSQAIRISETKRNDSCCQSDRRRQAPTSSFAVPRGPRPENPSYSPSFQASPWEAYR